MRIILCLFFLVLRAEADHLLPNDSRSPSTNALPWANVGVKGGIPVITNWSGATNMVTQFGADPSGVTPCDIVLSNALAQCPSNSAICFPAGTFLFTNNIIIGDSPSVRGFSPVVIRGVGPSTIFKSRATNITLASAIRFQGGGGTTVSITSGYERGSSNLVLSSVAGLSVGQIISMRQANDPSLMQGNISITYAQTQGFEITDINASTITISRPIYVAYSNTYSPEIITRQWLTNCGLEDFTFDCELSNTDQAIMFWRSANCWIKGVTITNAYHTGILLNYCYRNEITQCRTPYARSTPDRYGVTLTPAWESLVYDNIVDGFGLGWVVQQGASGNVIAYNFAATSVATGTIIPTESVHGDFANYNLFEGNVGNQIQIDATWGNAPWNTIFRNWATGRNLGEAGAGHAGLSVQRTNYFESAIGNVLGHPFNTDPVLDVSDASTNIFLHGNFDYVNGAVTWSNTYPTTLSNSYYLASKPSWFGNLSWPPIGPDIAGSTNTLATNGSVYPLIPARARYYGVNYTISTIATNNASGARVSGFRNIAMAVLPPPTIDLETASDTFNRTDADPMSNPMSDGIGTWSVGPGNWQDLKIASNVVRDTNPAGTSGAAAVVSSPTFAANQSISIVFGSTIGGQLLIVRGDSLLEAGYGLVVDDSDTIIFTQLSSSSHSAVSGLSIVNGLSFSAGETITLTVTGSGPVTLTAYNDGVEIGSYTDNSGYVTSGQPGIGVINGVADGLIDSFSATDL